MSSSFYIDIYHSKSRLLRFLILVLFIIFILAFNKQTSAFIIILQQILTNTFIYTTKGNLGHLFLSTHDPSTRHNA